MQPDVIRKIPAHNPNRGIEAAHCDRTTQQSPPVYSWNFAPVGLLCGADNADGDITYLAITLHAVLADLTRQGLDHLLRTLLA